VVATSDSEATEAKPIRSKDLIAAIDEAIGIVSASIVG